MSDTAIFNPKLKKIRSIKNSESYNSKKGVKKKLIAFDANLGTLLRATIQNSIPQTFTKSSM